MIWFSLAILVLWIVIAADLYPGSRRIRFLRAVPPLVANRPPRVSVIAAARNEERNVREALGSLLALDYPALELIVVNDRSEDGTGAILEDLAGRDRRMKVIHVTELPPGWLGKNHALWTGSLIATGDLLLFTDADIVMDSSAVSRAVAYLEGEGLDHLAVSPEVRMPGIFLEIFGASFGLFFSLFSRPWKAPDRGSRAHIGIGAFNLVRAESYRRVGGHETIRLRPDDDMKLGKILKKGGNRQALAYGTGLLSVEWYSSVGGAVRGLEKNAFSGCDYNVPLTLSGIFFVAAACIWPYLALFLTGGGSRLLYGVTVALITFLFADGARITGSRPLYSFGFPAGAALFAYILLRTMVLNLAKGGIEWRGTFYPLRELRKNRI
jgi:glycosyltransferase involved in cell wall biosynthesis